MYGQYNKVDLPKALKLRAQGLSNTVIAKRLDVTAGAIYLTFRKYDAEHGPPQNPKPHQPDLCWI